MDKEKKRKNPMAELLNLPDKGLNATTEILAILWRQILKDWGITPPQWGILLEDWYTATFRFD